MGRVGVEHWTDKRQDADGATSDHAVSRGRRGDKEQREVEEDYLFALPDGAPVQLYLPNIVNLVMWHMLQGSMGK